MARRKTIPVEEVNEMLREQQETLLAPVPITTDEEEVADNLERMLNTIAGDQGQGLVLYLYRAGEKNKALAKEFLKLYPTDIKQSELVTDIQDEFGAGDYVLISKHEKTNKIHSKGIISIGESRHRKTPEPAQPVSTMQIDHHLQRLTGMAEKRLILDKMEEIAEGKGKQGESGMTSIFAMLMKSTMETNTLLMKMLLEGKNEQPRTSMQELKDAIIFAKNMMEGKMPEEGETGLAGIVEKVLPVFVDMLDERKAQRQGVPVPGAPPGARVLPPGAVPPPPPGAGIPPPPPPGPPGERPLPVAVPEGMEHNPQTIATRRVLDEIRFCIKQPTSDDLFQHIVDYTENYLPGSLEEVGAMTTAQYLEFVKQLMPDCFPAHEGFFMGLHGYAVALLAEQQTGGEEKEDGA